MSMQPMLARTLSSSLRTSKPLIDMLPESGMSSVVRHLISVVFPAPLGPRSPKNSPSWMSRLTSFSASTAFFFLAPFFRSFEMKVLATCSARMMGSDIRPVSRSPAYLTQVESCDHRRSPRVLDPELPWRERATCQVEGSLPVRGDPGPAGAPLPVQVTQAEEQAEEDPAGAGDGDLGRSPPRGGLMPPDPEPNRFTDARGHDAGGVTEKRALIEHRRHEEGRGRAGRGVHPPEKRLPWGPRDDPRAAPGPPP